MTRLECNSSGITRVRTINLNILFFFEPLSQSDPVLNRSRILLIMRRPCCRLRHNDSLCKQILSRDPNSLKFGDKCLKYRHKRNFLHPWTKNFILWQVYQNSKSYSLWHLTIKRPLTFFINSTKLSLKARSIEVKQYLIFIVPCTQLNLNF